MCEETDRPNNMKPSPGGELGAENIVGRENLNAEMWCIIEGRPRASLICHS